MGMLMAVIGMITYSWAVEVAKAQAAKLATIKVKDPAYSEETLLLNKDDLEYGKSDKEWWGSRFILSNTRENILEGWSDSDSNPPCVPENYVYNGFLSLE